jgi:hypothetical protein
MLSESIQKLKNFDEYSDGLETFVSATGIRQKYSKELMQDRHGAIDKLCKQAIKERITLC